jgi:hypothetical protein
MIAPFWRGFETRQAARSGGDFIHTSSRWTAPFMLAAAVSRLIQAAAQAAADQRPNEITPVL